jgi:Conserved TM helix
MFVFIIVGGLLALILGKAAERVLRFLNFNSLCRSFGLTDLLQKAELPAADVLLARVVFWVIWIGFILSGFSALGLRPAEDLVSQFFLFIPQMLAAILMLAVGILVANFVSRAALLAAFNANWPSPRLLANFIRFFILILAVTMALDQLSLARTVVLTAFAIAFGAIMLALAIAFGMGGREVARRALERRFPEESTVEKDEMSHL